MEIIVALLWLLVIMPVVIPASIVIGKAVQSKGYPALAAINDHFAAPKRTITTLSLRQPRRVAFHKHLVNEDGTRKTHRQIEAPATKMWLDRWERETGLPWFDQSQIDKMIAEYNTQLSNYRSNKDYLLFIMTYTTGHEPELHGYKNVRESRPTYQRPIRFLFAAGLTEDRIKADLAEPRPCLSYDAIRESVTINTPYLPVEADTYPVEYKRQKQQRLNELVAKGFAYRSFEEDRELSQLRLALQQPRNDNHPVLVSDGKVIDTDYRVARPTDYIVAPTTGTENWWETK